MIQAGDADVVVRAHGVDDAGAVPPEGRARRLPPGDGKLLDSMLADGLVCGLEDIHMVRARARHAGARRDHAVRRWTTSREEHERAANAAKEGRFTEIERSRSLKRKGDRSWSKRRRHPAGTTIASLAGLRPAFDGDGSITAGTRRSSPTAVRAVVVMSKAKGRRARDRAAGRAARVRNVAGPDTSLLHQPSGAIKQALGKPRRRRCSALDLHPRSNEGVRRVGVASMQDLGVTDEIVNVNGGAIAPRSPIGCGRHASCSP